MILITATNSFEEENIRVIVEKFHQTMTQVNSSITPELQAAINKNDLMVIDQFLIIPNLRDCSQESLEVFGQAFQLLSDKVDSFLLENEHKSLENKF